MAVTTYQNGVYLVIDDDGVVRKHKNRGFAFSNEALIRLVTARGMRVSLPRSKYLPRSQILVFDHG